MERSAVYRRALAPIMAYNGGLGVCAALIGLAAGIDEPRPFIVFWASVAAVALIGSLVLVRRQALKDAEPFWSPPTRRVTQAMLPGLVAGLCVTAVLYFELGSLPPGASRTVSMLWLPELWIVLYGCAIHGAGFFMPRGMKVFGWIFILGGCGLFALGIPDRLSRMHYCHGMMGGFFGCLHLAYGIYLFFTEKRGIET
jgi:hypothetical protein